MEYMLIGWYLIFFAAGAALGTGIMAVIMVHWICRYNEMGEETGAFQDFVPGDVEIIKEKDYRMSV